MTPTQPYTTIISAADLMSHLGDPDWLIFDCRFDLTNPEWGFLDYQGAHIPGAVFADLNQELSAPVNEKTGRHPLPSPEAWIERLSGWGVTADKQVVVYDTTGGSFASRMWWMLRWVGFTHAAVLDGGFATWLQAGYPSSAGVERSRPAVFQGQIKQGLSVSADEVDLLRNDPRFVLIDARAPIRFRGESEFIDPVAGHIPGARNWFQGENLGPEGRFLPPNQLRENYLRLMHGLPPSQVIFYCGSGVTSCQNILAMEMAGLPGARLYPGSWSEWIRDPRHAIMTGE